MTKSPAYFYFLHPLSALSLPLFQWFSSVIRAVAPQRRGVWESKKQITTNDGKYNPKCKAKKAMGDTLLGDGVSERAGDVLLADNLVEGLRPALAGYDSVCHEIRRLA